MGGWLAGIAATIRSADPGTFWLFSAIGMVLGIICFAGAFWCLIRKRVIEDIPTSKVRSAAQGYVELSGHGELIEGDPIIAPLSRTPCTWYEYKVEVRESGSSRDGEHHRWRTLDQGTSADLFYLVDDTGRCVIDPEGAEVTPSVIDVWRGNSSDPDRSGIASSRFFGRYRFTEKRMHEHDALYAVGLLRTTGPTGGEQHQAEEVRELLREWKRDPAFLLDNFDADKDGEIDIAEWNHARAVAGQQIAEQTLVHIDVSPVSMLAKSGDPRRPFLLSALPEHHLTGRYRNFAVLLLAAFFAVGCAVVWALGIRLGGA